MDQLQQIISKISQISSILIITAGNNGDSLAASLALRAFLRKLEKEVLLLSFTEINDNFNFLPQVSEITRQIDLTKSFVINVATGKIQIAELSYKKGPEQLSIFLKPTKGEFLPGDVTFDTSNFPFELVILIGVPSLEILGELYEKNTDLFFKTPILNIDFKASNENYAQLNLVDLTTTSCSEMVLDLINKFEASLLDETIATQLLTGIITETNSFQHIRTTPQIFLKASQLVGLGAKQQEIVSHLYKNKSLGLLKLWGRVLARLKLEFGNLLVYSAVNRADLMKADATDEDAAGIIKEMLGQLGFAKIFLFLKEEPSNDGPNNQTLVYLASLIPLNFINLFGKFSPQALTPQIVKFVLPENLSLAEKRVLDTLRIEISKTKDLV